MSMGADLSILGLYDWDNTIFDLMAFPEGFTQDQKDTVIGNILAECAELEILYPNPTVMKNMIGLWSKKEEPYWSRFYKASLLEYDPIENYRRNEEELINENRDEQHSGADVSRAGGQDVSTGNSTSVDQNSGADTTTNKITGFDSDELVPHDETITQYGSRTDNRANGTNTQSYGRTDTVEHGANIKHDDKTNRKLLAYGNIGTMTSQDMLGQEYEIAKQQIIPIIIESFKDRFCIMVY